MIWRFLYHFIHIPIYVIAKLLFHYKAVGGEHIPKRGNAILASNHASYLDPPLVGLGVWRRINYLSKKEVLSLPLISYLLKKFGTIPIDRDKMDRTALRSIYQLLRNNEILLMFPEGTRSYDGKLLEPKFGVGMIAYNTRVPVIPVYINGSFDILPRNSKFIRLKPCSVYFGPPIDLKAYYNQKRSKEVYKEISEKIMEGIKTLEKKTQ